MDEDEDDETSFEREDPVEDEETAEVDVLLLPARLTLVLLECPLLEEALEALLAAAPELLEALLEPAPELLETPLELAPELLEALLEPAPELLEALLEPTPELLAD